MGGMVEGYTPYPVHIAKWSMNMTIVRTEGGATYFSVKHVCTRLGVSLSSQLEVLRADEKTTGALADFRIPTGGGMQEMAFIRKRECAWWILHISPKRVRADVRERLEELQADLMAVADRLVWGDLSDLAEDARRAIARQPHGELYGDCPQCGVGLCVVIEPGGAYIRIAD